MREGVYWQATYAPPEAWPYEEKHAFWAGWGLPNNNYLTTVNPSVSSSAIGTGGLSPSWMLWGLFTIYSPVSVLLFLARSLLGLFLATSLLRASRVGRVVRFRAMQSRFSIVRLEISPLAFLLPVKCQFVWLLWQLRQLLSPVGVHCDKFYTYVCTVPLVLCKWQSRFWLLLLWWSYQTP